MGWVAKFSVLLIAFGAGLAAYLSPGMLAGASSPCQNNPMAAQPCPGIAEQWRAFLELQELHASLAAARSFEAFLAGRDEEAMHYLRLARGEGPKGALSAGGYDSLEVARVQRRREDGCTADPYASNPCLGVAGAWDSFAKARGLDEGWESSRDFVADLAGHGSQLSQPRQAERSNAVMETQTKDARRGGLIIRVYPFESAGGS